MTDFLTGLSGCMELMRDNDVTTLNMGHCEEDGNLILRVEFTVDNASSFLLINGFDGVEEIVAAPGSEVM
jgi:hypothetical protein